MEPPIRLTESQMSLYPEMQKSYKEWYTIAVSMDLLDHPDMIAKLNYYKNLEWLTNDGPTPSFPLRPMSRTQKLKKKLNRIFGLNLTVWPKDNAS